MYNFIFILQLVKVNVMIFLKSIFCNLEMRIQIQEMKNENVISVIKYYLWQSLYFVYDLKYLNTHFLVFWIFHNRNGFNVSIIFYDTLISFYMLKYLSFHNDS